MNGFVFSSEESVGPLKLEISPIDKEFIDEGTVQLDSRFRPKSVKAGDVALLKINGRVSPVRIRGLNFDRKKMSRKAIWMDEKTRDFFGVTARSGTGEPSIDDVIAELEVCVAPANTWQTLRWFYHAQNPMTQIAARISIWSFLIGSAGFVLSVLSLFQD